MKRKFTHFGILRGSDRRTPRDYTLIVNLRETKNFWVTERGVKYRKGSGREANQTWPYYYLDVDTIKRWPSDAR